MRDAMAMHPKWVLLGAEGPEPARPCMLIACHKLHQAELEMRIDHGWPLGMDFPVVDIAHQEATITAKMNPPDILIISAPTWQEAFATLMRLWQPESGPVKAIEGTRQIEAPA